MKAEAKPLDRPDLKRCLELLRDFGDLWDGEKDPGERQAFVRLVFARIAVETGRIVEVEPRPEILPAFVEREGVHSRGDWI